MRKTLGILSAFMSIEFLSEYIWIVLILLILGVYTTAFVVFSICNNVIFPRKMKKINYIMPNHQKALAEIEELKEDNHRLREELENYKNNKERQT